MTVEDKNEKRLGLTQGEEERSKVDALIDESEPDEAPPKAAKPSPSSDADPFLLHMLRCEDLLERLDSALSSDENQSQRLREAFVAINERGYEAALKTLDVTRGGDEQNPLVPLLSAIALQRQGDAWQAASQCDAALALNALDVNALYAERPLGPLNTVSSPNVNVSTRQ